MEDDYHANSNLFFSIIEKEHEIDLYVFDWVRDCGCVLCLAFELLPGFYSSHHPDHIDYV
jgi:hypothetical protein